MLRFILLLYCVILILYSFPFRFVSSSNQVNTCQLKATLSYPGVVTENSTIFSSTLALFGTYNELPLITNYIETVTNTSAINAYSGCFFANAYTYGNALTGSVVSGGCMFEFPSAANFFDIDFSVLFWLLIPQSFSTDATQIILSIPQGDSSCFLELFIQNGYFGMTLNAEVQEIAYPLFEYFGYWTFITLTYNSAGEIGYLYYNGTEVDTNNFSEGPHWSGSACSGPLSFGYLSGSESLPFVGSIKHLAWYADTTLNAQNISYIYSIEQNYLSTL
jgi:Concanavalin A-like lectin/glucanases superfamily